MEGRVTWQPDQDRFVRQVGRWRSAEATHIGINTMGAGLASVDDHIAALAIAAQLIGLAV